MRGEYNLVPYWVLRLALSWWRPRTIQTTSRPVIGLVSGSPSYLTNERRVLRVLTNERRVLPGPAGAVLLPLPDLEAHREALLVGGAGLVSQFVLVTNLVIPDQ